MIRRPSILVSASIALLAVPSGVTSFDGLPFKSIPEACAVAVLVPLVFSAAQRRLLNRALAARPAWISLLFLGAALFAISCKAFLATARPPGFFGCYQSTLSPPPEGTCERSFDNPFFRFATRVDKTIDFRPENWDLSFVNSLRFNFLPTT